MQILRYYESEIEITKLNGPLSEGCDVVPLESSVEPHTAEAEREAQNAEK